MPLDPEILAKIRQDATSTGGAGLLQSVGNVLGAWRHYGLDPLARAAARSQGLNVEEDASLSGMTRSLVGLNQGDEGYAGRIGGRALEFGVDVALDPLTYAMGGLGAAVKGGRTAQAALKAGGLVPEAAVAAERLAKAGRFAEPVQKGATAAFTGLMGAGALQEGAQALGTIQEEGFTPKAAEEVFGTALSAGGAALSGAHLRRLVKGEVPSAGEAVTQAVRGASDQELASRLDSYEKSGQGELASIVKAEKDWREVKKAGISPDTPPEEAALRKALMGLSTKRQRSGTDLTLMMEAVKEEKLTSDQAYEAWKSSNKLPDVLGTAEPRRVVEAPPPTPPDQLEAALAASVEAKGGKPIRTAEQVAGELASGKPVDEVLPKDFNDFLRQRGFAVKAPRGPKESAFDKAQRAKAKAEARRDPNIPPRYEEGAIVTDTLSGEEGVAHGGFIQYPSGVVVNMDNSSWAKESAYHVVKEAQGEVGRVTGLPPEAGTLQPPEGSPLTATGGERGGVAPTEAAALGAAGVPGGPDVSLPGVEAPSAPKVQRKSTFTMGEAEDVLADVKVPSLEFDSPVDKGLWFLREQGKKPPGSRDVARTQRVLEDLRERGLSEEDIKGRKPIFKKVEGKPSLEEGELADFLPKQEVRKDFRPIVTEGAMETISENPSVKFLSGLYSQLFNRVRGGSPLALGAEGAAEIVPGQFVGETFGTMRGLALPKTKAVRFNPGQVAKEVVRRVASKEITLDQAVQDFLFRAHKNATHEATHLLAEAASHEGPQGALHTKLQKSFQESLSGQDNPLLERALEDPKFAREVWDAVKETAYLFDAAERAAKGQTPRVLKGDRPVFEESEAPKAKVDLKALKKRLASMKKIPKEKKKELLQLAKDRPEGLEEALRVADNPTKFEKAVEAWKMGLLSGPGTVVVQGMDVLETGTRVVESALAPLVDRLLGGPRTRFSGEARAEVQGFLRKNADAGAQWTADLRAIAKAAPEVIDPDRPLEFQTGKIGGKAGRIIRTPARLMNAFSKYLRTTGASAELSKLSFREATKELGAKATKEAVQKRAAEIYEEALSPDNEGYADLLKAAKVGGKERVFEQDPGPLMDALLKLRGENPWMHGLLPFLHVPGNITKLIGQRSPLGFVKAAKSYAAYKRAVAAGDRPPAALETLKGKAVDDLTRPLVGTGIMTVFAGAAAMGNMTGGGPVDKKKRNLLLSGGWQPYSFVLPGALLGEPGKKFYVPYKRIQPIGALLGFAADMVEAKDLEGGGAKFEKGLESLGQNLTSQTYLQGIADAMEFVSNPREMAAQYASSQAGSLVPNIFAKVAQAIDPTARETRAMDRGPAGILESMGRSVQARIPGASMALPPKMSATGEEIQRPGTSITRLLLPVQPTEEKPNAKVVEFLERIDASPGLPQKDVTIRGVKVPLEEEEWRTIARANAQAMDYIEGNYLNNPAFLRLPKVRQKRYVDSVFSRVRELARARLLRGGALGERAKEALRAGYAGS